MSYDPRVYMPNSYKTVMRFIEGTSNNTMSAGKKISLETAPLTGHPGVTGSSGALVIASGEHVLVASPYATIVPITSSTETPMEFRWYDVTNSQYIGVAGRRVLRYTTLTVSTVRAPCAIAFVDSAITVELRCVSISGAGANAWNSYPVSYLGASWAYIYTAI